MNSTVEINCLAFLKLFFLHFKLYRRPLAPPRLLTYEDVCLCMNSLCAHKPSFDNSGALGGIESKLFTAAFVYVCDCHMWLLRGEADTCFESVKQRRFNAE